VYTTVFDVKSLIETDKTDAEIMGIIKQSDSFVDMMLGGTSASSALKSDWSSRVAAYRIQSMSSSSGITGSSTSNISRIKIGDAEIQKEVGSNASSSSSSKSSPNDWRSQVKEEIKTHIRMCKRG
jgi:hypothetical protein